MSVDEQPDPWTPKRVPVNLFDEMPESLSPREQWVKDNEVIIDDRPDAVPDRRWRAAYGERLMATYAATRADAIDDMADRLALYDVKHFRTLP